MQRIDIFTTECTYASDDPPGYRSGMSRFGPAIGAKALGGSVYELPPGQSICPYHYEYTEEEWLLVLAGQATVRTPAGEEVLGAGELVCFPTGPDGAHKVTNATGETVRVLMLSTMAPVGVSVYPDSDKIGVYPGNAEDRILVHRGSGVDYWHGEP
jgi:uncharacterized cupin superfamily protein